MFDIPSARFSQVSGWKISLNFRVIRAKILVSRKFRTFTVKFTQISHVMRKPMFWFPTWSDTNQAVQLQKMARGLKFRI